MRRGALGRNVTRDKAPEETSCTSASTRSSTCTRRRTSARAERSNTAGSRGSARPKPGHRTAGSLSELVQRFRRSEPRRAPRRLLTSLMAPAVAGARHRARAAVRRSGCRRAVGRWDHASHGQPFARRPAGRPRCAARRLRREHLGLDAGRAGRWRGGHRQDPARGRVPASAPAGGDRAARPIRRLRPRRAPVCADPLRAAVARTGGGRGGAVRRIRPRRATRSRCFSPS